MPEAGDAGGELEPSGLAELFVVQSAGPDFNYPLVVARRRAEEGEPEWIAGALIGESDGGAVIAAFPGAAWNRQAGRRRLPTGALQYPKSYQVAVVGPENREEKVEDVTAKVWIFKLSSDWPLFLELRAAGDGDYEIAIPFGKDIGEGLEDCVPYAPDLQAVAEERYAFHSAVDAPTPAPSEAPELEPVGATLSSRVSSLESCLGSVKASLDDIAARLPPRQPAEGVTSTKTRPSAIRPPKRGVETEQGESYMGLDPAVVQAARTAGIPEAHLKEMANLVGKNKPKLSERSKDVQLPPPPRRDLILDETDQEEDDVELPTGAGMDQLTVAISKLTAIAADLAKAKKKPTTLDQILDGSGSAESSSATSTTKKNVAVVRALRAALHERPRELSDSILAKMAEDYGLRRAVPGGERVSVTARAWVETRSRIQAYPSTVKFAWILAGIIDSLQTKKEDEALARALVGLAAIEQLSLDRGSWTIAEPLWRASQADSFQPAASFRSRGCSTAEPWTPWWAKSRTSTTTWSVERSWAREARARATQPRKRQTKERSRSLRVVAKARARRRPRPPPTRGRKRDRGGRPFGLPPPWVAFD